GERVACQSGRGSGGHADGWWGMVGKAYPTPDERFREPQVDGTACSGCREKSGQDARSGVSYFEVFMCTRTIRRCSDQEGSQNHVKATPRNSWPRTAALAVAVRTCPRPPRLPASATARRSGMIG